MWASLAISDKISSFFTVFLVVTIHNILDFLNLLGRKKLSRNLVKAVAAGRLQPSVEDNLAKGFRQKSKILGFFKVTATYNTRNHTLKKHFQN